MGDCGGEDGIERRGVSLVLGMWSRRSWSWEWRWAVRVLTEWESWRVGVG